MLPLNPARISEQYQKATQLQKSGQLDKARAIYLSLLSAGTNLAEVHFQLASIYRREGKIEKTIDHLEQARTLKPNAQAILTKLADSYAAGGRFDDAATIYDRLIAAAPKKPEHRIDKAFMFRLAGDFPAAEVELERAMKLDPLRGEPYRMLTTNRKIKTGDPIIRRMRKALSDPRLSNSGRVEIGFAMAKAMEDTAKYDQVFRYLTPANATLKKAYGYQVSTRQSEVARLIEAFSGFDFTPTGDADTDFAPIFVTGLPRSGTTLVERILASHSQVTGGGEMTHALRLSFGMIGHPKGRFRTLSELEPQRFTELAKDYEEAVRGSLSFDRIFTDKAIQSHLVMGLLKRAIPSARFIVVRRDPRDLLYSIYKNLFAQGTHQYAYDLDDLAIYYKTFLDILDFWREALPGGFHEVHYEDLVADPENQTRALVAAAGLDWEDACLDFHKSDGPVKTLSVQQVRQPIYRTSAQAWRHYEADLAPLVAALTREGVVLDDAE